MRIDVVEGHNEWREYSRSRGFDSVRWEPSVTQWHLCVQSLVFLLLGTRMGVPFQGDSDQTPYVTEILDRLNRPRNFRSSITDFALQDADCSFCTELHHGTTGCAKSRSRALIRILNAPLIALSTRQTFTTLSMAEGE